MSTLYPDGITKEMAEDVRDRNDDVPNVCDKDNGALVCFGLSFTELVAEDLIRFKPTEAAMTIVLAKAMSTGIYLAREYPEWALLAQQELVDAFRKEGIGNGSATTTTEALRIITDYFVQRHPMQHTNQEQDIVREKSENERAHLNGDQG